MTCTSGAPESMSFTVHNDIGQTIDYNYAIARDGDTSDVGGREIGAGATFNTNLSTTNSQGVLQFSRRSGSGLATTSDVATVVLSAVTNPTGHPATDCGFQAHLLSGEFNLLGVFLP